LEPGRAEAGNGLSKRALLRQGPLAYSRCDKLRFGSCTLAHYKIISLL